MGYMGHNRIARITKHPTLENVGGLIGLGSAVGLAAGAAIASPAVMAGAVVVGGAGLATAWYAHRDDQESEVEETCPQLDALEDVAKQYGQQSAKYKQLQRTLAKRNKRRGR
jgi:hypothetical protein